MSTCVEFVIQTTILDISICNLVAKSTDPTFDWKMLRKECVQETMSHNGIVALLEDAIICNKREEDFRMSINSLPPNLKMLLLDYVDLFHALRKDVKSKAFYEENCIALHLAQVKWKEYTLNNQPLQKLLQQSTFHHSDLQDTRGNDSNETVKLETCIILHQHIQIHESSFIRRIMNKFLAKLDYKYGHLV